MYTFPEKYPVIVLVGPTASGKTTVAIALANLIHAEIISADSRQFYQLMDIGTAKPTAAERAAAQHHFVDFLSPTAEYSAGAFSREARVRIESLLPQKNIIVAGGSGMYITALLDGFFASIARDKHYQQQLKLRAEREGSEILYKELQAVDPERAGELHPNDAHRIVRALEAYHVTGQPLSSLRKRPRIPAAFSFRLFGLNWPREQLYSRIEQRVEAMMAAGLLEEVKELLKGGVSPQANALQTVGYRELVSYLKGEMMFDEAVEKIKQHTRNFAKRQVTWFRKDARIQWLDVNDDLISKAPAKILQYLSADR